MTRSEPRTKDWEDCLPHLRRYAFWLTRRPEEAEDLVQSTVERGLDRVGQFRIGTDLRRWLFTIMRRIHIDDRRKVNRRGVHVSIDDGWTERGAPGSQESHLRLQEVVDRMADLNEGERRVMRLSIVKGLSHAAIADRLNVAEGTVKSRLSRARRTLALEE